MTGQEQSTDQSSEAEPSQVPVDTTDEEESVNHDEVLPLVEPSSSSAYYTIVGDEESSEDQDGQPSNMYAPFQPSGGLPLDGVVLTQEAQNGDPQRSQGLVPPVRKKSKLRLLSLIAMCVLVVVLGGLMLVSAFAKPTMPSQPKNGTTMSAVNAQATTVHPKNTAVGQHSPGVTPTTAHTATTPTVGTTPQTQGTPQDSGVPSSQLLQQLGWTTAGLTVADAIQADRTAVTFTDREEGLVFNEPGTRTAAVFLLTPAGRGRFAQNDVRVSSDALWNSVTDPARQLIQLAVNEQPTLVKQSAQGQNQFAWVDVRFELWQSQIDPQHANQRIGGLEIDPATKQPRMHHMMVLLLQVAPGTGGTNAPMGGTGWLVSTYALDPAVGTLPNILTPA